jgi:hypothetical protein
MSAFRCEFDDPLRLRVLHRGESICEVRDLRLTHCVCAHGADSILSDTYPLPLYWHQYAHNDDPVYAAFLQARMEVTRIGETGVTLRCEGETASGSAASACTLEIRYEPDRDAFRYIVRTSLRVRDAHAWPVDPNPNHGELEFCTFWAKDSFMPGGPRRKRYSACYLERKGRLSAIPHHHLESSDKHDILMNTGDRLFWGIEQQNPVIELTEGALVHAGICAFMWDAHIGYRAVGQQTSIEGPVEFTAEYALYTLTRAEAERLINESQYVPDASLDDIPIYVDGINRFDITLTNYRGDITNAWPWERQTDAQDAVQLVCRYDCNTGYDDQRSLQIIHASACCSSWMFTCLGPAYGQAPFLEGLRYHLSACVRVKGRSGKVRVAVRLHREGQGRVFDLSSYEVHASPWHSPDPDVWKVLTVWTPTIAPAPDRIHLMLQYEGEGVCWFDNVLFDMIA